MWAMDQRAWVYIEMNRKSVSFMCNIILCILCFNYVHKMHVCNTMVPGDPQLCSISNIKIPTAYPDVVCEGRCCTDVWDMCACHVQIWQKEVGSPQLEWWWSRAEAAGR